MSEITDLKAIDPDVLPTTADQDLKTQWKLATTLAGSALLPEHFRGKPADCFLVVNYATCIGEPVMMIAQGLYVVRGKLGFAAQLLVGLTNRYGPFDKPIRYEVEEHPQDGLRVRAWSTLDKERFEGMWVSMAMAKAENWTKNPKYATMGELMLRNRAATFFIRHTCPEVIGGARTLEELEDMSAAGQLPEPPRNAQVDTAGALNDEVEEAEPVIIEQPEEKPVGKVLFPDEDLPY